MSAVLEVRDLHVSYASAGGRLHALRGASLGVAAGEVLGIVGESGCGKSTLAGALMNLLPGGAQATGEVLLGGENILTLPQEAQRALRGRRIALVSQDPMTAFNPVLPLGAQLTDFQHALPLPRTEKRARAEAMLVRVGLADPASVMGRYPHQLSGGMKQRAAIAAALLMTPEVLVADEPTSALDVTMEAQILHLLRDLRRDYAGAVVIITHHLGVVAELCDRVAVLYAGEVVEEAPVDALFHAPAHPYTQALISCDPAALRRRSRHLPTIAGRLPDLRHPPQGCAFAPRCPRALPLCTSPVPRVELGPGHRALCHRVQP